MHHQIVVILNMNQVRFLISAYIFFICLFSVRSLLGQDCYWQMKVKYDMDVDFDVDKNSYHASQSVIIYNNSADNLSKLFFHLYLNAFQPGSDMDIRSINIMDPDKRVGSRISSLKEDEIGFQKIESISTGSKLLKYEVEGTIMKIYLDSSLRSGDSILLNIVYNAQVPVQIRRNGRHNAEGIDFSMAQWYPKLCEYDKDGWHTNPYVGREFYGVWGDYKMKLAIASNYCVAATGYQLNSKDINCANLTNSKQKSVWEFYAPNVHDFVWAADPEFVTESLARKNGIVLNFVHKKNEKTKAWELLPNIIDKAFDFIEKNFGPYGYNSYSFIQAGDGGMEYPMATFITGNRPLNSLVGVSIHELMHSWYQMMLATDESQFPWMDEGFTSYAEYQTMQYLKSQELIGNEKPDEIPFAKSIDSYRKLAQSGLEEPMTTDADHYETNYAYGSASYVKGSLTLLQLEYILGQSSTKKGLLDYYWKWRFKHPNDDDFFRVMEMSSDIELDWFHEYWVKSTKTIDYGIDTLFANDKKSSKIILSRNGFFPMPIDMKIELEDGSTYLYNIPLDLMRGTKKFDSNIKVEFLKPWHWVKPKYEIELAFPIKKIKSIVIDPLHQMADIIPENNIYPEAKKD